MATRRGRRRQGVLLAAKCTPERSKRSAVASEPRSPAITYTPRAKSRAQGQNGELQDDDELSNSKAIMYRPRRRRSKAVSSISNESTSPVSRKPRVQPLRKRRRSTKRVSHDNTLPFNEGEDEDDSSCYARLDSVYMKPGRKASGSSLEVRDWGIKYITKNDDYLRIEFSNIKYAFYQRATKTDSVILLQFYLKEPITIGKKEHYTFQFYCDVAKSSPRKLNTRFDKFVKQVKLLGNIEFETANRYFEFTGLSHRSIAMFAPSQNCLVSYSSYPFFMVPLSEVELINLERVRNEGSFDMVIVKKNYSDPVQIIESIPMKSIDTVRNWINSAGISYFENPSNFAWKHIMNDIISDKRWDPWGKEGWSHILGPDDEYEMENMFEDDDEDDEDDYIPDNEIKKPKKIETKTKKDKKDTTKKEDSSKKKRKITPERDSSRKKSKVA